MSIRPSLIGPHVLMVGALGKTRKAVWTDPRTGEDKVENATLLVIDPVADPVHRRPGRG